ncbi:MAG: dihydrodipicolinate synthase family protein, partial [Chitinophagales bacterium]
QVISGDDIITLPLLSAGCVGVISVVAQAFPKEFSGMVNEALKGNFEKAQELHYILFDFMELFFAEGSPSGVKAALSIRGICENRLRLPLVPVSNELEGRINNSLSKLK